MRYLNPLKPLILPAVLLVLFVALAFNYRLLAQFDTFVSELVRTLPREWEPFFEKVSVLGNFFEDIIIIVLIAAWELFRRHYNRALISILALTAFPVFFFVKEAVTRARPSGEFVIAANLPGYSFPSGHAVTSAAAFGLLAIMLFSHLSGKWRYVAFGLCGLLIVAIGISRVYLGAHYPTDVLAGWLLALTVLSLLRGLSIYIASRTTHKVSDTTESPDATA